MGNKPSNLYHRLFETTKYWKGEKIVQPTIESIFHQYQNKSFVLKDILANKTTFKEIVKPIVDENLNLKFPFLNGACNTEKFTETASVASSRLIWLMYLDNVDEEDDPVKWVDLTERVRFNPWKYFVLPFTPTFMLLLIVTFIHGWNVFTPAVYEEFGRGISYITLASYLLFFSYFWNKDALLVERRHDFARKVMKRATFLDSLISDNPQLCLTSNRR